MTAQEARMKIMEAICAALREQAGDALDSRCGEAIQTLLDELVRDETERCVRTIEYVFDKMAGMYPTGIPGAIRERICA